MNKSKNLIFIPIIFFIKILAEILFKLIVKYVKNIYYFAQDGALNQH